MTKVQPLIRVYLVVLFVLIVMVSLQMYFKQNFIRRLRNLTSSSLISARSAMRNQNNYLFGVNIFKSVSVLCKIRSILSRDILLVLGVI